MPAAVAIPVLEVLAFALVAIVAVELVNQFIVQPLQHGQSMVSGIPVIGGSLAWAVGQLITAIQIGLSAATWMADQGRNDAFNAWTWLVQNTVGALFAEPISWSLWVRDRAGAIQWIVIYWNTLWAQAFTVIPNAVSSVAGDLAGLHAWLDGYELPLIRGIGDDLAGLHHWIDGQLLPQVRGIGDDLAGLHHWIDTNVVQKWQLAQAEQGIMSQVTSLVVPIESAITDIENSPCMKYCSPLGDLGQALQVIEDAGVLALALGLLHEAITDPGSLERDIASVVIPVAHDVVASLQLGIQD